MYTYHFVAKVEGVTIDQPVSFAKLSPSCKNISMEQHDRGTVSIHVSKTRTNPEAIALNEAKLEVEEFLDRLSLIDNHHVVMHTYAGYTDDGGRFHEFREDDDCSMLAVAGIANPATYYALDRQKIFLVSRLNPGLARLHRIAQGMPDGIGKYLLLYGALQTIYETQAEVDLHLIAIRPDTLMVQGKHRLETVLTRLRNMIAHPENDVDVGTLTSQTATYCPVLIEIVRDELIRQIKA